MVTHVIQGMRTPRTPLCKSLRTDGASCVALRRTGSLFCFAHDPSTATERAASQAVSFANKRTAWQAREKSRLLA